MTNLSERGSGGTCARCPFFGSQRGSIVFDEAHFSSLKKNKADQD